MKTLTLVKFTIIQEKSNIPGNLSYNIDTHNIYITLIPLLYPSNTLLLNYTRISLHKIKILVKFTIIIIFSNYYCKIREIYNNGIGTLVSDQVGA